MIIFSLYINEKMLTGDKNIDSIILKNLNDEDLFNFCLTGKYGRNLYNYEPLWYNILKSRFPFFLNIKPKGTSSKNYYNYLVKTVGKLLECLKIENIKNVSQETLKNLSQKQKDEALVLSGENGYLEVVKYLIENGTSVHACNVYSLLEACRKGHLEIVKYLVQNGADIHAIDDSPVQTASRHGHLEIVKYLIENKADIHSLDDYPLRYASNNGHLEVVKYLVENGADIHANNDQSLKWATMNKHQEVVEYLQSL